MQSLWPEIQQILQDLEDEILEFERAGNERVRAELEAKKVRAYAEMEERERKTPASIIPHIIYSKKEVQDAELARGLAEVREHVSLEKINELKHRLTTLRDQHGREWSAPIRSDYGY